MKAFVTGGTGFLGSHLVRRLRGRGDEVVALVRSRDPARELEELGCEVVEGDLSDRTLLARGMEGCDAAFHLAAVYKIGIPASERAAMRASNVAGTENVLDAAVDVGLARTVYVSTMNAFGDTGRRVLDEACERPPGRYLSVYDETKHRAHEAALRRIAAGAPIVIVQPGVIYGPGDHSEVGNQIRLASAGKLPFVSFPDLGLNVGYVDDIAGGIVLAHDEGRLGESYVLGGQITTMRELIRRAAEAGGRRPPRLTMPTALIRPLQPLGPLVGRLAGTAPNLREVIRASDGVSYWASDAKARRELGYRPRDLDDGLRDTLSGGS